MLSGPPGQFQCGSKRCEEQQGLKSWEVNFAYVEHGEKRNALVKLSKYSIHTSLVFRRFRLCMRRMSVRPRVLLVIAWWGLLPRDPIHDNPPSGVIVEEILLE